MPSLFQNLTIRAAGDLLADLTACRSLRHLTAIEREMVVHAAMNPEPHAYVMPKHPGKEVCPKCKRPKSAFGALGSLCRACYKNRAAKRFFWIADAFQLAFARHGYCCDCCPTITPVHDDDVRRVADRALEIMDGRTKILLCQRCTVRFKAFATRRFKREVRPEFDAGLEKIMLAFVAQVVSVEAQRVVYRNGTGDAPKMKQESRQ